jgi:hypothetical protein
MAISVTNEIGVYKVVPVLNYYAVKAYGRSGCIDPYFLDLGTSKR